MKCLVRAALAASFLTVSACGLPYNKLTADERKADMEWAFSIFKHNYAPAELKKNNYGVEIASLESDCVSLAEKDQGNQDFLALFQKCIHSFKDAHVAAQQMNNGLLPEYAQVAHLGFVTFRTKTVLDGEIVDALRIVRGLKGSDTAGAPLVPGDLIVEVNEKKVADYLRKEIVPYLDPGQEETALTVASFRFGIRTSNDMALPVEDDVRLKVLRGPIMFEINLPWVRQDMLQFELTQNPPEEGTVGNPTAPEVPSLEKKGQLLTQGNALAQSFFGYEQIKEILKLIDTPAVAVSERLKQIAQNGFRAAQFNPILKSLFEGGSEGDEVDLAVRTRSLPMSAEVADLMSEPMFTAKAVTTDDGQTYAYIQIANFPAEDNILTEWFRAITAIQDKGIKSVIIDMVDNGGGSLVHGMRMLNMIRQKPLKLPSLQVRLNNNWMNSFRTQAAFAEDDYAKTIAARVVRDLEEDKRDGKSLSRPLSIQVLDPFFLQNPTYGLEDDVKIALIVNELCVSMCDIFASVFQDNEMGTIIGQRTMGGGGNVTQHGLSPVSKIGMALTESLIISPNGKFLEDNGVTPEVNVDMVVDRESGFKKAFQAAYDAVVETTLPAPAPAPAP